MIRVRYVQIGCRCTKEFGTETRAFQRRKGIRAPQEELIERNEQGRAISGCFQVDCRYVLCTATHYRRRCRVCRSLHNGYAQYCADTRIEEDKRQSQKRVLALDDGMRSRTRLTFSPRHPPLFPAFSRSASGAFTFGRWDMNRSPESAGLIDAKRWVRSDERVRSLGGVRCIA